MENEKKIRKGLYLVLAILVAVIFWLYVDLDVANNGEPQHAEKWFYDIPIEYTNVDSLADRGLMLLEENTDTTVDLKLEGTRWNIARLTAEDVRVTADLSNTISAGRQSLTYQYSFSDSNDSLNDLITVKDRSPYRANINIAELHRKTIEIRCDVVGTVAEGCIGGKPQMSETELEIRGQQEDIASVSYAKVTLDIGENADASVTQSLSYQLYDVFDRPVDAANIHPDIDAVQVTLPVSITKEVTLVMNFIEAPGLRVRNCDYSIQPSTITVSGEASKLRDIDEIVLNDFDLQTLTNEPATYSYPIVLPDGCQNRSGITQAILQISRSNYDEKRVEVQTFRISNDLPANKHIEIVTTSLWVKIFGSKSDIEAITGEDLTIDLDLSEYTSAVGTYTVPVTISANQYDIGISGEYEVQISIRDYDASLETPDNSEVSE